MPIRYPIVTILLLMQLQVVVAADQSLGHIYRDSDGSLRLTDMVVYGRKNTAIGEWLDLYEDGVVQTAKKISTSPNVPFNMHVQFAHNSTNLTASGKSALDKLADALRFVDDEIHLEVQGHTDALGNKKYNEALSTSRARAVVFYLTNSLGIGNTMSAIGLADEAPVASNSTQRGRAQNRRVTILNRSNEYTVSAK